MTRSPPPSWNAHQAPRPGTYQASPSSSRFEYRPSPYGRGGRGGSKVQEVEVEPYAYEDEDQSTGSVRAGARVRHAHFGEGTVISVEPVEDDARVVVRFSIGQKTLRAKYARLEVV